MGSVRTNNYAPPVNQLLAYEDARIVLPDKWPNYLELGLSSEQIPDLIRMATDEGLHGADLESLAASAPIHAWRALGQLRAEEAIEPLLSLFDAETVDEGEWAMEELPNVFAMIGPATLPALAAYIADDVLHDKDARLSAIPSIEQIAARWPEARPACIELLTKQLERFEENELDINAFLILGFMEMRASEAAPLIERVFAARCVDSKAWGDWKGVQFALGLLSAEEVEEVEELEQRRAKRDAISLSLAPLVQITLPLPSSEERRRHEASHKKAKGKMMKQSRKKNRKR
jgi:hypothetical protein